MVGSLSVRNLLFLIFVTYVFLPKLAENNGGEGLIVHEHPTAVVFELDAFPEPKALRKIDLKPLLSRLGTISAVARSTGLGWSAIYERLSETSGSEPQSGGSGSLPGT